MANLVAEIDGQPVQIRNGFIFSADDELLIGKMADDGTADIIRKWNGEKWVYVTGEDDVDEEKWVELTNEEDEVEFTDEDDSEDDSEDEQVCQ